MIKILRSSIFAGIYIGADVCTVLGNLIGCNLYRIVLEKTQYTRE